MTSIDKLKGKVKSSPISLRYSEIEKLLIHFGFKKIFTKGSHIKFKHPKLENDLIIPIHNNDCKDFYKKQASKFIHKINKKS